MTLRDKIHLLIVQLFFAGFSLQSILMSTPMFYTPHSPSHLFSGICVVNAVLFAVAFFGVYRRASFGWTLGLVAFMLFYVEWMLFCLAAFLKGPRPSSGMLFVIFLAFGLCLAVFTALQWLRLKPYFLPRQ